MQDQPTRMWSGRFRESLNRTFEQWQRSFPFDWRLLPHQVAASDEHDRTFQHHFAAALLLACMALCGCNAKADHVVSVPSNDPNLFYTVESSDGHGPLSSGATDVYAHLNEGKASDRKLVLHGLYLKTRVTWVDSDNVTLCLADGLTSEYYNEITLNAGGAYRTIHNHLKENC